MISMFLCYGKRTLRFICRPIASCDKDTELVSIFFSSVSIFLCVSFSDTSTSVMSNHFGSRRKHPPAIVDIVILSFESTICAAQQHDSVLFWVSLLGRQN